MNIDEFNQIKQKLIECDLLDYIKNLSKWFRRLKDIHIRNLLNLTYDECLKKHAWLLTNINFLGSENYLFDIDLLKVYDNKNIDTYEIYKLLSDKSFIESRYHKSDLIYILSSGEDTRKHIIKLARSSRSIESKYHRADIETLCMFDFNLKMFNEEKQDLSKIYEIYTDYIIKYASLGIKEDNVNHLTDGLSILRSRTDKIAEEVVKVALNKDSLESKYHNEDVNYVYKAKKDEIAHLLAFVACNKNSLKTNYHNNDMRLISEANNYNKAAALSSLCLNTETVFAPYHEEDMKKISDCNNINVKYLGCIASSFTIKGKKHDELLDILSKTEPDKADLIYILSNFDGINSSMHFLDYVNYFDNNSINVDLKLYEVLYKLSNDSKKVDEFYDVICNLKTEEEKIKLLDAHLNKVKKEIKLINLDKLNKIEDNIKRYVDDNNCNELPNAVFKIK